MGLPLEMERPAIIAVMGLPYTLREEIAKCIAKWAKGPNLKFEVIFDALRNDHENDDVEGGTNYKEDVAFNVLLRTALSLGDWCPPNCVVINFPIPSKCKSQLQKLLSLCEHRYQYDRRLLIIECRRRNKFRWQTYVEDPDAIGANNIRNYMKTWDRKPGEWKEVEKAMMEHQQQRLDDNYFLNLSTLYPDSFVSRLVVDTFEDLRSRDFTEDQGLNGRSLFAEAIKCLLAGDYNEYQKPNGTVDYALWRRQWLEHKASSSRGSSSSSERSLCDPGDCILRFTQNNLQAEAIICEACDDKVTEGAYYYYCQLCSLSLHESCGMSSTTRGMHMLPRSQVIDYYSRALSYSFPETYACHSCEKEGKPFSWECNACIFRTHLKCQLLPTALKHSCDQHHILSIRISWTGSDLGMVYDCKACGLKGVYSSYSCNICNSEYHLECLLELPLHTTKDVGHGGHIHNMNIQFSCGAKEDEYEWCLVCYEDINPETWVYTCKDCDYVAHLYCIFPSDTFKIHKLIT